MRWRGSKAWRAATVDSSIQKNPAVREPNEPQFREGEIKNDVGVDERGVLRARLRISPRGGFRLATVIGDCVSCAAHKSRLPLDWTYQAALLARHRARRPGVDALRSHELNPDNTAVAPGQPRAPNRPEAIKAKIERPI